MCSCIAHRTTIDNYKNIMRKGVLQAGSLIFADGMGRTELQLTCAVSVDDKRCEASGRNDDQHNIEILFLAAELYDQFGAYFFVMANGVLVTRISIPTHLIRRILRVMGWDDERAVEVIFDRGYRNLPITGYVPGDPDPVEVGLLAVM